MITPMEELRRRNDAYINNMLQQTAQHSKEHIQAATLIYEERDLANPKKQALIKKYPALRKEVAQKYQSGTTEVELISLMTSKGMSLQDTNEMIANAVRLEKKEIEKSNVSSKNKSLIVGAVMVAFYIGFKIFLRMNR